MQFNTNMYLNPQRKGSVIVKNGNKYSNLFIGLYIFMFLSSKQITVNYKNYKILIKHRWLNRKKANYSK